MHTNTINSFAVTTLSVLFGSVAVSCNSDAEQSDSDVMETTSITTDPTVERSGTSATERSVNGATDGIVVSDGTATMAPNDIRINSTATGTPAYSERYAASKDVRGYRALLMAELDMIRARLNDGTREAVTSTKDQARAAELAQGLERMDRLIRAVEESDDLVWTSIRTSSLKEASEVRIWSSEHGYKLNNQATSR